jgi:hypothetical protein
MRPRSKLPQDPLKEAALVTIRRIVDPLIALMLDTGITVQELGRLVRERAVRTAAARIAQESGRPSNSRVAIVTGLARSEVARILKMNEAVRRPSLEQHPARKVLTAWHEDRQFLDSTGDPAVLPIFGKRRSFEKMVTSYCIGIPVRAMLDQLSQTNSVEVLPGQRVRVKSRVPMFKGMNRNAIANIGDRAEDLLGTLGHNLRVVSAPPLFEATTLISDIDLDAIPFVRRQIAEQGTAFIDGTTTLLSRSRAKATLLRRGKRAPRRLGVTVYYFESESEDGNANGKLAPASAIQVRRKNLNRKRGKRRSRKL